MVEEVKGLGSIGEAVTRPKGLGSERSKEGGGKKLSRRLGRETESEGGQGHHRNVV